MTVYIAIPSDSPILGVLDENYKRYDTDDVDERLELLDDLGASAKDVCERDHCEDGDCHSHPVCCTESGSACDNLSITCSLWDLMKNMFHEFEEEIVDLVSEDTWEAIKEEFF